MYLKSRILSQHHQQLDKMHRNEKWKFKKWNMKKACEPVESKNTTEPILACIEKLLSILPNLKYDSESITHASFFWKFWGFIFKSREGHLLVKKKPGWKR